MSQKFRVKQMRVKSESANRSGIVTENMTSATADKVVGTTFKNVLVDENGEFVASAGPANGVNNGLNVDAGVVVLGQDVGEAGDPAKLLSDREIPMDGKNIELESINGSRTIFRGTDNTLSTGGNLVVKGNLGGVEVHSGFGSGDNDPGGNIQAGVTHTVQGINYHSKGTDDTGVQYTTYIGGLGNPAITEGIEEYMYPRDSSWSFSNAHGFRGVRPIWDASRSSVVGIKNLLGSSTSGEYYLGRAGYIGGTAVSGELPPVLSTPTTETLAIDTATGQIVRYNTTIFGAGFMNALQYTTTGNIMSTVSLTLDRPRQAYFDFNQDVSNTGGVVDFAYIEIYVNGVLTFPGFTQGTLIPVADDGLLGEYQFQRADFIALPAGAVTIDARLYSGSGNLFGQNQGRFKVFCI